VETEGKKWSGYARNLELPRIGSFPRDMRRKGGEGYMRRKWRKILIWIFKWSIVFFIIMRLLTINVK